MKVALGSFKIQFDFDVGDVEANHNATAAHVLYWSHRP